MGYKRYTQLPVLLDMLQNRRLTVLDPSSWQDRNDTYFLEQYAQYRGIPGVLALCLTKAAMTFHHWHVYAGGDMSGVRIEFDKHPFDDWVRAAAPGAEVRKVKYFRLNERDDIKVPEGLPFAKRHAFRDEGEVRVIVPKTQPDERVRHLEEMPLSLIKRVTVSPWLPPTLFDPVKDAILHAAKGAVRVRATTLLANERFKEIASFEVDADDERAGPDESDDG